jgi:hypothetical protein
MPQPRTKNNFEELKAANARLDSLKRKRDELTEELDEVNEQIKAVKKLRSENPEQQRIDAERKAVKEAKRKAELKKEAQTQVHRLLKCGCGQEENIAKGRAESTEWRLKTIQQFVETIEEVSIENETWQGKHNLVFDGKTLEYVLDRKVFRASFHDGQGTEWRCLNDPELKHDHWMFALARAFVRTRDGEICMCDQEREWDL